MTSAVVVEALVDKISGLAAGRVSSARPAWAPAWAVFGLEAVTVPFHGRS